MVTAQPSEILADLIVGLAFFALGLVAYLASKNTVAVFTTTGAERRLNLSYAAGRIGFIIMVGLITEAVFRAGAVLPEWRTFLYIAGSLLVSLGYLGVAIEGPKVKRGFKK